MPLPRHPGFYKTAVGHQAISLPVPIPGTGGLGGIGSGVLKLLSADLIAAWFSDLEHWVGDGASWVLRAAWAVLSATTEPVVGGKAFDSELHVMVLIGAGAVLPLLGLTVIQAVLHQDASALMRTALVRLPIALLFTGVAVEIVSLGLSVTDSASVALISTAGDPTAQLFAHLEAALVLIGGTGLGAFGGLLLVVVAAVVGLCVWLELAVRSAALAAATLFLPLALAGLVWPTTSHWARRLGETLAALVLMKLVMAAVLALAAGAIAGDGAGLSGIVEGLALLVVTCFSPFALMRLIPMVESGAVSHFEGVSRRPVGAALSAAKNYAWMRGVETNRAAAAKTDEGGPGIGAVSAGSNILGPSTGAGGGDDGGDTRAGGGGGGGGSGGGGRARGGGGGGGGGGVPGPDGVPGHRGGASSNGSGSDDGVPTPPVPSANATPQGRLGAEGWQARLDRNRRLSEGGDRGGE
jgi:hypothetical protein